jgi:hypothetical protein
VYCAEDNCCAELAACGDVEGCIECVAGNVGCTPSNQAAVDTLLGCFESDCAEPCLGRVIADATCAPTGAAVGACVTLGGAIECNPVTNEGCDSGAGEACDLNAEDTGYTCYPGPNTLDLCEECPGGTEEALIWCSGGQACVGVCGRFCCEDGECTPGVCQKDLWDEPLPAGLGICTGGND